MITRAFRDYFRRRRVARHIAENGPVFTFHGVEVRLPGTPDIGACNALLRGKYERGEALMILAHLPPDRAVIELGGSLGVVSRLIGSRLAENTPHVVVEANPALIETCTANATGGGRGQRTRVVEGAIAYGAPHVRFKVGSDIHSNTIASDDTAGRVIEVRAVSLGDVWRDLGAPEGYSLVCDIEGGEVDMLTHDAETLAQAGLLIMEIHPRQYPAMGSSEASVMSTMAGLGFVAVERTSDVVVWRRDQPSSR